VPVTHQPKGSAKGGQFAPGGGSGGAAGAKAGARPTPTNQNPVGMGERGQRVKDLQTRLNAMGAHLAVDGQFGPATLAAVRALQKKYGLKTDGLVGPKTTAALRGQSQGRLKQKNLKKINQKRKTQGTKRTQPQATKPTGAKPSGTVKTTTAKTTTAKPTAANNPYQGSISGRA